MRIKLGSWSLMVNAPYLISNAKKDHECLNGVMEGTYACEYCYPICKKCGKDPSDWEVDCYREHCMTYGKYVDWKWRLGIHQ